MKRPKRAYDHRLKKQIAMTQNPNLFPQLKIPRSTAKNWIHRGVGQVVTLEIFDLDREKLEEKCFALGKQVDQLKAQTELNYSVFKVFGFDLQYQRFSAEQKEKLIEVIEKGRRCLTLHTCLEIVGLSEQRFNHWLKRQKQCQLADRSSCPKLSPTKITDPEISTVKKYVGDPLFSHFSTSLWYHLRRTEELIISSSSWFRIIRDFKMEREHRKKYVFKPRVGMRAAAPNQIWHIDVSVLRFNGIKAYVQAVRDNFSRYVLAYRVSENYGGTFTSALILSAIARAKEFGYFNVPQMWSDKGSENVNSEVSDLAKRNLIQHVLALVDVQLSNSMIESFFHQLKNRFLYFKGIHMYSQLVGHIDFYVHDHNEVIPFCALNGVTPLEAYRSSCSVIVDRDEEKRRVELAIKKRVEFNRSLICPAC